MKQLSACVCHCFDVMGKESPLPLAATSWAPAGFLPLCCTHAGPWGLPSSSEEEVRISLHFLTWQPRLRGVARLTPSHEAGRWHPEDEQKLREHWARQQRPSSQCLLPQREPTRHVLWWHGDKEGSQTQRRAGAPEGRGVREEAEARSTGVGWQSCSWLAGGWRDAERAEFGPGAGLLSWGRWGQLSPSVDLCQWLQVCALDSQVLQSGELNVSPSKDRALYAFASELYWIMPDVFSARERWVKILIALLIIPRTSE